MRADLDGANVEKLPARLYTNFPGAEFRSLALLLSDRSDRSDCNANAIHDDCEVQRGFRTALPDFPKNRYLTLETSELQPDQVIRLTFTNLAPPFDVHNGKTMWVDQPFSVSANSGSVSPVADFPNFEVATLRCDPLPLDWSEFSTVDVFHELIVPGSLFTVDVFDAGDLPGSKPVRSWALTTAIWGDHAGPFDIERGQWILPDGRVDITTDAVAALDVFRNQPCTMHKTRADVYPATVDAVIDIVDISSVIDAFRGEDYPFEPPTWSCP